MSLGLTNQNAYLIPALNRVPALLAKLDREMGSGTYGSFDREYWGWKLRDFPPLMLQVGFYPLALLWRHALPGNSYQGNPQVLAWTCAAVRATLARQHRNGAFDSVGPFTQDHGVTLALVHYLCEMAQLLGDNLAADLRQRLPEAVRRACEFAAATQEDYAFISNHQALFALAWLSASELLGEARQRAQADAVVAGVLRRQSPDGWYAEYGGPDPGYETLGLWYLAKYWQRTQDAALLDSLRRSVQFLSHCVHPDGSVGGVYGSRHTMLYFPAGLEMLAGMIPEAAAIAGFMRERLSAGNVVTPANSDAQNLHLLLASYFEAALCPGAPASPPPLPCQQMQGVQHFSDSGITIAATPAYYAVIQAKKGGVCRIFDRRTGAIAYEDAGYLVREKKHAWISQLQGLGRALPSSDSARIECEARFALYEQLQPTPWRFLLLRFLNLTLFRSRVFGAWIRGRIISRLITGARPGPLRLRRTFTLAEQAITVSDCIELLRPAEILEVACPRALTGVHMGSAKYFHPSELRETPGAPVGHMAGDLTRTGKALCRYTLQFAPPGGAVLLPGGAESSAEILAGAGKSR